MQFILVSFYKKYIETFIESVCYDLKNIARVEHFSGHYPTFFRILKQDGVSTV